jgi:hypothetical protein
MKFYFGGFKNENQGICNFVVFDLGLLHRSVIDNKTDELTINFSSLFLLFGFIASNPEVFKETSCFDIYGDPEVLLCFKKKKIPRRVESYKEEIVSFMSQNFNKKFQFFNISKKRNKAFFRVDTFDINLDLSKYINEKIEGAKNDSDKN